jgi:hypothetical protein
LANVAESPSSSAFQELDQSSLFPSIDGNAGPVLRTVGGDFERGSSLLECGGEDVDLTLLDVFGMLCRTTTVAIPISNESSASLSVELFSFETVLFDFEVAFEGSFNGELLRRRCSDFGDEFALAGLLGSKSSCLDNCKFLFASWGNKRGRDGRDMDEGAELWLETSAVRIIFALSWDDGFVPGDDTPSFINFYSL